MERNDTIMILLVIVIAAVAICASLSFADDGSKGSEITGEWYAVSVEGYDMEGNYTEIGLDDPKIVEYDLEIHQPYNNTVSGYCNNLYYAGAVFGNTLYMETFDSDDRSYVFNGKLLGNGNMSGTIAFKDYDDPANSYVISIDYSTDRSAINTQTVPSIEKEWPCVSAHFIDASGDLQELVRGTLNITEQTDSVFKGTVTQNIDGNVVDLNVTGAFVKYKNNGSFFGNLEDEMGMRWNISFNGDSIVLSDVDRSNSDMDTGEIVSIERLYSDNEDYSPKVYADLVGTEWTGVSLYSSENDYYTSSYAPYYRISFDYQEGNILKGTFDYNDRRDMTFCGYIMTDDPLYISVIFDFEWMDEYGIMVFDGDDNFYFCDMYGYDNWSCCDLTYFSKTTDNQNYDIVGHWYNQAFEGYYGDTYRTGNSPYIDVSYDLRIYGLKDNVFWGYYDGEYITGTYLNGDIDFMVDGRYEQVVHGTMINESNMILSELIYNGTEIIAISAHMTNIDLNGGYLIPQNIDISGDWNLIYGTEGSEDTSILTLGGSLTINSYENNVFLGSMEQYVYGTAVTKKICGMIVGKYDFEGKEYHSAVILDDTGVFWDVDVSEDVLIMGANYYVDLGYDDLVSATYVYAAAEKETYEIGHVDMNDVSWNCSSTHIMDSTGKYNKSGRFSFDVVGTFNNGFYGTATYNGETMKMAGFVFENYVGFSIMDEDLNVLSGFGYVNDNGSATLTLYLGEISTGVTGTLKASVS